VTDMDTIAIGYVNNNMIIIGYKGMVRNGGRVLFQEESNDGLVEHQGFHFCPLWCHSVCVNPGMTPAKFEFCSTFHWNGFINWAPLEFQELPWIPKGISRGQGRPQTVALMECAPEN
jgi:hypothetical protein